MCVHRAIDVRSSEHGQASENEDGEQIDCYQHAPSISISLRHGFFSALTSLVGIDSKRGPLDRLPVNGELVNMSSSPN